MRQAVGEIGIVSSYFIFFSGCKVSGKSRCEQSLYVVIFGLKETGSSVNAPPKFLRSSSVASPSQLYFGIRASPNLVQRITEFGIESPQTYLKYRDGVKVVERVWLIGRKHFSSYQKISPQLGKFLGVLNRLDKREKGAIQAYLVKNKSQKTRRKVWQFKRKAYLCTRNRETMMVAKAIFEDIYIIRQVVQESESSISIKSTVNKMTLDYDEETESGLRI